jgi:DNA-binding NarL/FixJ family response regulator
LCLSENTIETHRRRIIMKLGARNIIEAVAKGYTMGILKK